MPRFLVGATLICTAAASIGYSLYILDRYYPSTPNLFAYIPPPPTLSTPSVSYFDAYYGRPWTRWPAAAIGALTFLLHSKMQQELGSGRLGVQSASASSAAGTVQPAPSKRPVSAADSIIPLASSQLLDAVTAKPPTLGKSTSYGTASLSANTPVTDSRSASSSCRAAAHINGNASPLSTPSGLSLLSRVAHTVVLRWWPISVLLAVGVMLMLISVTMTADVAPGWPRALTVTFNACSKPLFVAAAAIILLVSLHHRDAPSNRFFGHPAFQVLAKLTFGLYLTHIPVIMTFTGSVAAFQRLTPALVLQTFCGAYATSLALAAVLYITVELPAANLVKACLKG